MDEVGWGPQDRERDIKVVLVWFGDRESEREIISYWVSYIGRGRNERDEDEEDDREDGAGGRAEEDSGTVNSCTLNQNIYNIY